MVKKHFWALFSVFSLVLCSCNSESKTEIGFENFDYDAYNYQENWFFESGHLQSPINIDTSLVEEFQTNNGQIELDYENPLCIVEDIGYTINVSTNGSAVLNGRLFTLEQFHFHAQSEHTIDNKHLPIEAHFVHRGQNGHLAVIAVFFEEGVENNIAFQDILESVDAGKKNIDIIKLFPENLAYYHYIGSLTTPPLNENVEWYILKQNVRISSEQISEFQNFYDNNNRTIQSLNDRTIFYYK